MLSLNDIITAAIALAAVAVPTVAAYITVTTNRRAARSSLTDLTLQIGEKAAKYVAGAPDSYAIYLDIWVLAREADDIRKQLRNKFPESVGIKIAQALELVNEWEYADRYWLLASQTADPMFRARTLSFWALALFWRGQKNPGRLMTEAAVKGLTLPTADAAVFRGDTYRFMGDKDPAYAVGWYMMAGREFEAIPRTDERRQQYFQSLVDSVLQDLETKDPDAAAAAIAVSEDAARTAAAAAPAT